MLLRAMMRGRSCSRKIAARRVWRAPFTQLRVLLLFNLRRDPFEKAQHNSSTYNDWFLDRAFVLVPIQGLAAQFPTTMKEYAPNQVPGSFNLSKIEEGLREPGGNGPQPSLAIAPPSGRGRWPVMVARRLSTAHRKG
ncbi:hypothetical protein [Rhizobium sp. LjRoot258]|uniref:hypothetical protein n=1 Tax=Rhizobium sp. LjRoot258 TaxID=3342299 RepID=UPI003ECFE804